MLDRELRSGNLVRARIAMTELEALDAKARAQAALGVSLLLPHPR